MICLDALYLLATLFALLAVWFSNSLWKFKIFKWVKGFKYGASHKFVGTVLFLEIFFLDYYCSSNGTATPYGMYSLIQLVALSGMFVLRGGGVWKIAIMSCYLITQSLHLYYFSYHYGDKFPYLDFIVAISYIQLMMLLFSPKTESAGWYGRIGNRLINVPVLGGFFSHYISNRFDGTPTDFKKGTTWK